ncbi:MAG: PPC domain-containing protein [Gemmatimonadota bacterium]
MRTPRRLLCGALTFTALIALPAPGQAQSRSILELLPTEGRVLEMGGSYDGALSGSDYRSPDDAFMEAWALEGQPGQTVTVDMVSETLDSYLYVVGPGLTETLADDDGAGGCNARVTFTVLDEGTFHVVAAPTGGPLGMSYGMNETGTYTLTVSERPGPALSYTCGETNPEEMLSLPTGNRVLTMFAEESGELNGLSQRVDGGPRFAGSVRTAQGYADPLPRTCKRENSGFAGSVRTAQGYADLLPRTCKRKNSGFAGSVRTAYGYADPLP